jgi:hypothetical protein
MVEIGTQLYGVQGYYTRVQYPPLSPCYMSSQLCAIRLVIGTMHRVMDPVEKPLAIGWSMGIYMNDINHLQNGLFLGPCARPCGCYDT